MSKDNNPKRTAAREARQRRQLPPDAVCLTCSEDDPRVLELHHPVGRAHEPELTAALCKNCHGKATEAQLREEVPLEAAPTIFHRVAAIFGGLAAFFRFLAESCDRLVDWMKAAIARLDASCPEWRSAVDEGE